MLIMPRIVIVISSSRFLLILSGLLENQWEVTNWLAALAFRNLITLLLLLLVSYLTSLRS
jgi:hypothetical protein